MSELYPDKEEEHKAPLWFRMLPKPIQYYLFLRELRKWLDHPDETVTRIERASQAMNAAVRALQGESEGERE